MDAGNHASEKAEVEKIQDVAAGNLTTGSEPALGTFADVDEKKILHKVRDSLSSSPRISSCVSSPNTTLI